MARRGPPRTPPKSLEEQLLLDEKYVRHVYKDSRGYDTIGIGLLVDARVPGAGLTQDEALWLLRRRLEQIKAQVLVELPWTTQLDPVRLAVLHNMAYQMGLRGLLQFKTTLRLVQAGSWLPASQQMMKSLWAQQTPNRAARAADQMRTGTWQ